MNAKIWKKNAVLATVILFVCVAVYLNWSYGRDTATAGKVSPSPTVVSTAKPSNAPTDKLTLSNDGIGEVLDVAVSSQPSASPTLGEENDYFASARLSRQQARDSSLAILRESGELETASQEARDEAVAAANALAENAMKEAEIEGLVMAKGFSECVAYISSDGVDVVVAAPEGGLVAEQVSQIKDIVVNETQASVESIRIVGME